MRSLTASGSIVANPEVTPPSSPTRHKKSQRAAELTLAFSERRFHRDAGSVGITRPASHTTYTNALTPLGHGRLQEALKAEV
jgi:hypothetical protein